MHIRLHVSYITSPNSHRCIRVYRQALHLVRSCRKMETRFCQKYLNRQEIKKKVQISLFVINDIISNVFAISK